MATRIGLALGGGGWRGLAHIGVLRALEEAEIRPARYAGASAGALVAAAAAHQVAPRELERLAVRFGQRALFQLDLAGLLRHGLGTRALYREQPVRALCRELFGDVTFRTLAHRLMVSTADLLTGAPVVWGAVGQQDVLVADAVYASCAMPGLLPPGRVGAHLCADGTITDPLALGALGRQLDRVIVVALGAATPPAPSLRGAALWWRAQGIVMDEVSRQVVERYAGPPLVVIRPRLEGVHTLRADDPASVIRAGYVAAARALEHWDAPDAVNIQPRRSP